MQGDRLPDAERLNPGKDANAVPVQPSVANTAELKTTFRRVGPESNAPATSARAARAAIHDDIPAAHEPSTSAMLIAFAALGGAAIKRSAFRRNRLTALSPNVGRGRRRGVAPLLFSSLYN